MSRTRPALQNVLGRRLREVREDRGWSQDRMAKRARDCGLNWTRSALAKVERGEREIHLGEFLLLPAVLGLPLDALFPHDLDAWIQLTPTAGATAEALRRAVSSKRLTDSSVDYDLPAHRPGTPPSPAERARVDARLELLRRVAPRLDFGTYYRALTVTSDAERKAAVSLSTELNREVPPEHVVLLGFRAWGGRTLIEERERRLAEHRNTDEGLAARRGHITRALISELKAEFHRLPPASGRSRRKAK